MAASQTLIHVSYVIREGLAGHVHDSRLIHVIPYPLDAYLFYEFLEEV